MLQGLATDQQRHKLEKILADIISFLSTIDSGAYFSHMNYLEQLLDSIRESDNGRFAKMIDSPELWGGSGSLRESEYGMGIEQRKQFKTLLLELLEFLRGENIIGKRASTVYKVISK